MTNRTVDFTTQGDASPFRFTSGTLTVTGSSTLNLLQFNGLGVIGGGSDFFIDTGEWVNFSFSVLVENISLVCAVSNADSDGFFGECQVEAFGANGISLGLRAVNESFVTLNVSALFDNQRISSFRFLPNGDSFRPAWITYSQTLFLITPADGTTTVVEGGATDQITVSLAVQPTRNVALVFDGGNQLATSLPILTFTPANWNVPQTVTISAIDDAFFEGNQTGTLTFTPISGDTQFDSEQPTPLTYSITDNDAPPVNLNLVGTANADLLTGGVGNDTIQGLEGDDTLSGLQGSDGMDGGLGNDQLFAGLGSDTVSGGDGNDLINGGAGADSLSGGAASDTLNGGRGVDSLNGGRGLDVLNGGADNDFLNGGIGIDTLQGGGGADTFFYTPANTGTDTMTDFAPGEDVIQVSSTFGGGLVAGVLSADTFVVGTAAGDTSDRFIYNSTTGALLFDIDGAGAIASLQIATLSNLPSLTAASIVVV